MSKYFTEMERYCLETMLADGIHKQEIAQRLNKSLATIYNEIKRGTVELIDSNLCKYKAYKADYAQKDYREKQTAKGGELKIGNDYELVTFIEEKIKNDKWSPQAIIGHIKQEKLQFNTSICFKTLYNYINAGLFLEIGRKNIKKYKKKSKDSVKRPCYKNIKNDSIENRPEHIKERAEFGHWEMDTVIGQRNKQACLLVLSERMTRTEIIRKIDSKSQKEVKRILDELEEMLGLEKFKNTFKTITMDNGTEFINSENIVKSIDGKERTKAYYCHPFSSWERGTNENINKMIRRWIPKGVDITSYTYEEIAKIEYWINNYPRKIFGYKTSLDMLQECIF